jgi:hypothetical protein
VVVSSKSSNQGARQANFGLGGKGGDLAFRASF